MVARAHLCAVIHFCCATLQRNLADVEDVKFVINFDYPNNSEDYIHRIGRTARSQKTGTAYTFFTHNNVRQAGDLVSVLREANQAINPKLLQMVEDRGGKLDTETAVVDARSYYISFIIIPLFRFQVAEEAGAVTSEMTDGIDTLEGVTLVVIGTAITVEGMTISLLVQTLKMVCMAPAMAPAMASLAMVMDSQLLPTRTRRQRLQSRTTSRPSSLHQLRMALRLL